MSPAPFAEPTPAAVRASMERLWTSIGARIRTERLARHWTTLRLARAAGVSRTVLYSIERGDATTLEAVVRVTNALRLRVELDASDPRRRSVRATHDEDPVHAAMGELEAGHLDRFGPRIAIDEPYQHYQFAGRADLLACSFERASLLHLENWTQFPNLGEAAGAWNAKRAYLPDEMARRLGVPRWRSVTHVMVCLWSSEVLHAMRLHRSTSRALGPDPADGFAAWWSGAPPPPGTTSSIIVLDPFATGRERLFIDLATALRATTRPRVRGYAEAAALARHRG